MPLAPKVARKSRPYSAYWLVTGPATVSRPKLSKFPAGAFASKVLVLETVMVWAPGDHTLEEPFPEPKVQPLACEVASELKSSWNSTPVLDAAEVPAPGAVAAGVTTGAAAAVGTGVAASPAPQSVLALFGV